MKVPQSLNELGIVTKQRKVNLFLPLSKLFLQFLLPFHFKISMNMRITRNKITTYLTFRGRLLVQVDCMSSVSFIHVEILLVVQYFPHTCALVIAYLLTLLLVTWHCNILPNEIGSDHFPRPRLLVWLYQWLYSVYEKP